MAGYLDGEEDGQQKGDAVWPSLPRSMGIEDAEFTVANSASVENVLKETYQGEDMTERKRSYARDHLLNSL